MSLFLPILSIRKKILTLLFLCFAINKSHSQTLNQRLEFCKSNESNWEYVKFRKNASFELDSTVLINNKRATLKAFYKPVAKSTFRNKVWGKYYDQELDQEEDNTIDNNFAFYLNKTIVLPAYQVGDQCKISIRSKVYNAKNIKLSITTIDSNERFIKSDSIDINSDEWKQYNIIFKLTEEKAVNIFISCVSDTSEVQIVHFESPSIFINNKNIGGLETNLPQYFKNINMSIDPKFIIPLFTQATTVFPNLKMFKDKKILALGECTHGSVEIKETAFKIIKDLIIKNNCKLILTEFPIDISLLHNLYVLGLLDEGYITEIEKDLRCMFGDYTFNLEFIKWLRYYNEKHEPDEKIYLLGMDVPALPKVHLAEFFYFLIGDINSSYFSDIENGKLNEICTKLTIDSALGNLLGHKMTKMLQNIIQTCLYDSKEDRDFSMYKHTQAMISALLPEEKIVIFAHSAHLNMQQSIAARLYNKSEFSLGYRLSQKYKSKYYAISIQVGTGFYTQDINSMFGPKFIDQLQKPAIGSLEKELLDTDLNLIYYPSAKLNPNIIYRRNIFRGTSGFEQFEFGSLANQFDGYIFIRNSTAKKNEEFTVFYTMRRLQEKKKKIKKLTNIYNKKENVTYLFGNIP